MHRSCFTLAHRNGTLKCCILSALSWFSAMRKGRAPYHSWIVNILTCDNCANVILQVLAHFATRYGYYSETALPKDQHNMDVR